MTGKISWVIHLFLFYHRENRNEKIPPYGGAGFFRIEEIRMNLPGMEGGSCIPLPIHQTFIKSEQWVYSILKNIY